MVGVDPPDILLCQKAYIQRLFVDRHPGQMAKAQKRPVFIFLFLHHLQNILGADAELPRQIHSRFVADQHPRPQCVFLRILLILPADTLRSLMDIQDIADTMARPVLIIQMRLPKSLPCQNIQIPSRSPFRKYRFRQP